MNVSEDYAHRVPELFLSPCSATAGRGACGSEPIESPGGCNGSFPVCPRPRDVSQRRWRGGGVRRGGLSTPTHPTTPGNNQRRVARIL